MADNVPSMLDFVERTIRLALGNPIMLLCEKEKEIKEDAEYVGLMDYYSAYVSYIVRNGRIKSVYSFFATYWNVT